MRQFTNWKVSIISTHTNATTNATATVAIHTANRAIGFGDVASSGLIYTEAANLGDANTAANARMVISSTAGGTGVSTRYKVVPALRDVHSNLCVAITFAVAPTSGNINIVLEGAK